MKSSRIFDYFCKACEFKCEAEVPWEDNPDELHPDCPVCEGKMDKLMPAPPWKWGGTGARGF
jgi:putative FmdB family regulatory protein